DIAQGAFAKELQAYFAQTLSAERTRGTLLRFAALVHDVAKSVTRLVADDGKVHFYRHEARGAEMAGAMMRRLRFSNDEIEFVTRCVANHLRPLFLTREPRVTNRAAYRFFRDAGETGVGVCVLTLADQRGKSAQIDAAAEEVNAVAAALLERYYRASESVIAPPALVDGRVLMDELKISPGPRIGELLEAIREAQAGGEVKTRDDALEYARKIVDTTKAQKHEEKNN
ncbi:MAG TPA: HD domain-containing protein, partial [Anaerolineae bacterium]